MNKTETEKPQLERERKYFSPETREKLSIAMKKRWARQRKAQAEANLRAVEAAAVPSQSAIMRLYSTAAELVDVEVLRSAIANTANTHTLCFALSEAQNEGTSLQTKLREVLVGLIAEAIQ
jgi:hypothetical protein